MQDLCTEGREIWLELKEQRFGIEIEMTGITREEAARVTAAYFGTDNSSYVGL